MMLLSPRRRAQAWRAAPLSILVLAISAFHWRYHAYWRDEMGVALLGRGVSWRNLPRVMRYEGVPPLFHAFVKLLGLALSNPATLAAARTIGLSVLFFGTYRLLAAVSDNPRGSARATLALGFTYVYAYELGAMVRQYTLGLGLCLLSFAYLRTALRRTSPRRWMLAGTLTAALAALTSAHAACVAGAGLLAFGSLSLARRRPLRAWWPILLTLPCFAYLFYLAMPFPDREAPGNQVWHHTPMSTLRLALQVLVDGVMPTDWWLVESDSPIWFRPWWPQLLAVLRSLGFWGLVAGGIAALAARSRTLWSRRGVEAFDLIAGLAGMAPLLEIFIRHYWGSNRHHLFLGMPPLVIVIGWGLDRRPASALAHEVRRTALAATAPWFVFEALLAAANSAYEVPCAFSDAKLASTVLPPGAHVVLEADWQSMGLLFWRPDIQVRSPSWQGRAIRYLLPDVTRHQTVPVASIVEDECRAFPTRASVYFAGNGGLGALASCSRPLPFERRACGERPIMVWEVFNVSTIDCACIRALSKPARPGSSKTPKR